uniref:Uncharacterized protein n=1 Tax=Rhizophora mucronata TaxID=61149 RepID=A0A2P2JUK5_RHIMU
MPQELQNEEKPTQGEMDQGLQAAAWKGYDTGSLCRQSCLFILHMMFPT